MSSPQPGIDSDTIDLAMSGLWYLAVELLLQERCPAGEAQELRDEIHRQMDAGAGPIWEATEVFEDTLAEVLMDLAVEVLNAAMDGK